MKRRLLCIAALALVVAGTPSSAHAASIPRLAYGFDGASVEGVFVVRVNGAYKHPVSHGLLDPSGGTFAPDWSPDGKRIAFAGQTDGGADKIYTVRPDGSGQVRLTRGASCFGDNDPDWSGHSFHLVFARIHCDPAEVMTVRRDGTELRHLTGPMTESTTEIAPRWSPNSRWIAFMKVDESDFRFHVWAMRRDGSDRRELTPSPPGPNASYPEEQSPQWSPDSTTLVYFELQSQSLNGFEGDVCTVPITGGPRNCLTNTAGADYDAHYSPDGSHIVFVSERDGNPNIYVMDADGSNEHALTLDPAKDDQPEWSPNGRWIVFVSRRSGHADLYAVHPGGTGLRRVTHNVGTERAPTWAP